ncbi:hypothetical protein [Streptomyces sp. NPDC060022]|uniref:hypothetical protein n=1 Tax=Streptomyces sp. NPDC060022 TaxID=3347039 RepID=UPI0036ACD482
MDDELRVLIEPLLPPWPERSPGPRPVSEMAHDIVFFLAPDDESAAATRQRGPGQAFESVTSRFIEPDSAIAEWDMFLEEPSAEIPPIAQFLGWSWPEWVIVP